MVSAKQKAWRQKFGRIYGGRKHKRKSSISKYVHTAYRAVRRKTKRVYKMARRQYRRRGGGLGSLTPLVYGAGASFIAPKIGLNVNPLIAGACGGFLARKNIMGGAMGAAGAYLASMFLGSSGSNTGW